ncbi:uncharacterized protein DUF2233 [Thermosporothrix hazakensis]|jgi:uncharacterized protein YigE (DUF2233 family)|uniref:Uncharacterized protein DUF2233 n=2 Tax=Thermosporothrix TaxID=768650 RepID=A0A326UC09_THEHA|nr:phosphodiester glycosidase family protein [Thermosporothrix hazakensis]PZW32905.1 uncharacterized protein DUF2233 [Thermosporothrix hazakensis]BBH90886.1 hypothetical protein KTC_56370 [Thermosporothrix sp. COM3]GCE48937.1 hypothetical protein KTH_38060 [Thermosporothrix hazakensis]
MHQKRTPFLLLLLLLSIILSSCSLPGLSIGTDNSGNQANGQILNKWLPSSSGIEVRYERWKGAGNNEDLITIVRMKPQSIKLSVAYQPTEPLTVKEWMQKTGARAIINGGYFDAQNRPTALLVSNGQPFGNSYEGFGGMLSVDAQGTIGLRSLNQQPYDPSSESVQQATQSAPMLVIDGKRAEFNANADVQRRTVVALDKEGNLLFIVSSMLAFTLDEMADLLVASDLSIQTALNLDGGSSTGLYVHGEQQKVEIDANVALPIVIVVK